LLGPRAVWTMSEQLVTGTTLPAPAAQPHQSLAQARPYRAMAITVALIATAFVLGLAVAGGAKSAQPVAGPGLPTGSAFMGLTDSTAPYDLRFLDEMIAHHAGAILSVQMMITDSTHPELRDLGRRIVLVQQQQIDQMRAWRGQWYSDAPPLDTTRMGMMSGGMMGGGGMMGRGVLTATNAPTPYTGMMRGGAMADRMFLRMMIPHHQLAIDMAQDALVNAQHEELKQLSRAIISGQSAEITEMAGYLKTWYGEDSTRNLAAPMRGMMQQMMGGATR